MPVNFRKHLLVAAIGLGTVLVVPASARNSFNWKERDQDRQDQNRDRDRNQEQDRNQGQNRNQDRDRHDRDYTNSKAYQRGFKDGGHDRDKHRAAGSSKKRWKNEQDRQAYEAGYNAAYRGDESRRDRRDNH